MKKPFEIGFNFVKQHIVLIIIVLLVLSCGGILTKGIIDYNNNIFTSRRLDDFTIGESTKEEVKKKLGKPYKETDYSLEYYGSNYKKINNKIEKIQKDFEEIKYKHIEIQFDVDSQKIESNKNIKCSNDYEEYDDRKTYIFLVILAILSLVSNLLAFLTVKKKAETSSKSSLIVGLIVTGILFFLGLNSAYEFVDLPFEVNSHIFMGIIIAYMVISLFVYVLKKLR